MEAEPCRYASACHLCLGVGETYRDGEGRRVCVRCRGTKVEPPACRRCRGSGQRIERIRRFRFLGLEFGDLVPRVVDCPACDGFGYL